MRKILAFHLGCKSYAIETADIEEVIPYQKIHEIPDVPCYLLGVINLRHQVIPVVDLELFFHQKNTKINNETCIVITSLYNDQSLIGFLVDKIDSAYTVEENQLSSPPQIGEEIQSRCVKFMAQTCDGVKITLDVDSIFNDEKVLKTVIQNKKNEDLEKTNQSQQSLSRKEKLLTVTIGQKNSLVLLSEIMKIHPASIMETDQTLNDIKLDMLVGFINSNEKTIGVVDAKKCLDMTTENCESKIIMTSECQGHEIGFLVDNIGSLLVVDESQIKQSDSFDYVAKENRYRAGFFEVDKENTLEIISLKKLLLESDANLIESWNVTNKTLKRFKNMDNQNHSVKSNVPIKNPLKEFEGSYLVFKVNGDLMGIKTYEVDEVVIASNMISLPFTKHDFQGVMPLRDKTYAILNMAQHFDDEMKRDENLRDVVILLRNQNVGLLVDEIVRIDEAHLENLISRDKIKIQIHTKIVHAIFSPTPDKNVHLINVSELLNDRGECLKRKAKEIIELSKASSFLQH